MKIETQPMEDHQVRLIITADEQEVLAAKQAAARKLSKKIKLPGFRPGKAPLNVVERYVGDASLMEEAIEEIAKDLYPKALDEAGVEPFGPGALDKIASLEPPTLEFIVPLQAVAELGDYKSVRVNYEPPAVTDERIEEVIANLRQENATVTPVDRPAQAGDQIQILLSAKRTDPTESKPETLINERSQPVVIETDETEKAEEWPFPGFSRLLIGMSTGDEQTFTYTFPADSQYTSLQGDKAEFAVKVESVSERSLPEVNDEFAVSIGQDDDLAAMNARIRAELEQHDTEEYLKEYDKQVVDAFLEKAEVKYAPQMVEREIDDMVEDLHQRLHQQGMELDQYLMLTNKTMEALREEMRESAVERIKRSVMVYEISQAEKVEVSEQEIQARTADTLAYFEQVLPEKDRKKLLNRDRLSNMVSAIMVDLMNEKTRQRLREIARGEVEQEAAQESTSDGESTKSEEEAAQSL